MTLEARRKNQGKQYTVVSQEDRVIRHWHRPGDHLPVIIGHNGKDYLLTKEVVEEARIHQRSRLIVLEVDAQGDKLIPCKSAIKRHLCKPVGREVTTGKGIVTELDQEINWKAVAAVVIGLFAVGLMATALTLGA